MRCSSGSYRSARARRSPEVNLVNDVPSEDTLTTSLASTVTIQADPEAEWARLIPVGAVGAVFREKQGASILESTAAE